MIADHTNHGQKHGPNQEIDHHRWGIGSVEGDGRESNEVKVDQSLHKIDVESAIDLGQRAKRGLSRQ